LRYAVFQATQDIRNLPGKPPNNRQIAALVEARVRQIGNEHPKMQKIIDTVNASLRKDIKRVREHYHAHDKMSETTEYFYWRWSVLDRDTGKHTASNCKACQEQNLQAAVFGKLNIDANGNPVIGKKKRKTMRRESCSEDFLGFRCIKYGVLEAVTVKDVMASDSPGAVKLVESIKKKVKVKARDEGIKHSQKVNEEHMRDAAMLEWMGNTMSMGRMVDRRSTSMNSVPDSEKNAQERVGEEESGEKIRRYRGGEWGRSEANRRKLFLELDK
jgi:hypothetical protein